MRILKSRTAYQKALDGTTLIRFQKLAILGFGFCEAWFFSAVVGGFLYTGTNAEAAHFLRAALIFSLALGFALSKVIGPAVQSQKSSNRAVLICGVLSAVAGCVLAFFPDSGDLSSVVALICSLVIGVSVSLILMAGSQAWTHVSMDFIGFSLSISLVFACLLYLVCAIAPVVPRALIVSFLPLVCALTLKKPFRYKIRKNTPTSVFDLSHYAKRIVVFLGLFYCVFGLSAGMTSVDNMTVFFRGQDAAFLGALLYSLLLVMGGLLLSSQVVTQVLRKSYLIFYVLGLLVFIALPSRFMYLGETFLLVGFIILDNFVWLLQPSIKIRSSKDDYSVFGKSRLVCYGALFVGFVGGYGLTQLPSFTTGNLLVFACAVSLLTVVVAQTVIMSETAMLDLMEARRNLYEEQPNIEKRCEELASLAKISPRELEVMILLAKGRSYAHIENELFISRNTVKSHVNHIYRKVGVASRQELLDLIYASGVGVNFFS